MITGEEGKYSMSESFQDVNCQHTKSRRYVVFHKESGYMSWIKESVKCSSRVLKKSTPPPTKCTLKSICLDCVREFFG